MVEEAGGGILTSIPSLDESESLLACLGGSDFFTDDFFEVEVFEFGIEAPVDWVEL